MTVCFAWGIGGGEMLIIMAAILVLFGAKRIPEFAKGLGHAMREFNKAKNEVTQELQNAMEEDHRPRTIASPNVEEPYSATTEHVSSEHAATEPASTTTASIDHSSSSPGPDLTQNHPPATVPRT
jgi:sec-independent protein translocase protein TatA